MFDLNRAVVVSGLVTTELKLAQKQIAENLNTSYSWAVLFLVCGLQRLLQSSVIIYSVASRILTPTVIWTSRLDRF